MLLYLCVKKYTQWFIDMLLSAQNHYLTLGDDSNGFSRK
jgi:hypothetical protein